MTRPAIVFSALADSRINQGETTQVFMAPQVSAAAKPDFLDSIETVFLFIPPAYEKPHKSKAIVLSLIGSDNHEHFSAHSLMLQAFCHLHNRDTHIPPSGDIELVVLINHETPVLLRRQLILMGARLMYISSRFIWDPMHAILQLWTLEDYYHSLIFIGGNLHFLEKGVEDLWSFIDGKELIFAAVRDMNKEFRPKLMLFKPSMKVFAILWDIVNQGYPVALNTLVNSYFGKLPSNEAGELPSQYNVGDIWGATETERSAAIGIDQMFWRTDKAMGVYRFEKYAIALQRVRSFQKLLMAESDIVEDMELPLVPVVPSSYDLWTKIFAQDVVNDRIAILSPNITQKHEILWRHEFASAYSQADSLVGFETFRRNLERATDLLTFFDWVWLIEAEGSIAEPALPIQFSIASVRKAGKHIFVFKDKCGTAEELTSVLLHKTIQPKLSAFVEGKQVDQIDNGAGMAEFLKSFAADAELREASRAKDVYTWKC
ncbi:hypothetical protein HDU83_001359 [Entophlyctis luteolus]|nr:hypothetical protein HDU83_001359 [Entophlyctis luteolus]